MIHALQRKMARYENLCPFELKLGMDFSRQLEGERQAPDEKKLLQIQTQDHKWTYNRLYNQ